MVYTVSKMWASCFVSSTLLALAMSAGNEYLPPSKGYNYDKPPIPFPPSVPNKPPSPPVVRPPPVTKPPPSYIPPTSGYNHGNEIHDQTSHHEHHDHGDSHDHGDHHHHEPGMPFDFSYQVAEDGNDYSHNAISDGDVTRGEYRVALPDGRTQIVKYTADWKNGFNAQVTYEGEAKYPDQPAYGSASGPAGYNRPSSGPGQAYVPPSQGGGYQY